MPIVSAIVPTRDRPDLLRRAVASVLRQTFEDFELIIVDDHSSHVEATLSVLPRDRRIAVIHHDENRGVAAARNSGVARASGRYIAFLDDDDEWHSQKLQRQVDLMNETGPEVGAAYCGYEVLHPATGRQLTRVRPVQRGHVAEAMLLQSALTATSTVLVRRECFDRVGAFNTSLRYGEDFDMWLRVAHHYRFEFVDEVLASVYFQRAGLTQNFQAVISWYETHLSQYRQFFELHRAVYANHLQKLGIFYCFNGDLRNGRRAFRRALDVDRFALKNYACLALTLLGTRGFRASYLVRDRMIDLMA